MSQSDTARYNTIASSFAAHYYRVLVQEPQSLASLYSPSALVNHCGRRASCAAGLPPVLEAVLFAARVAHVRVESLTVSRRPNGNIIVTVKGALASASASAEAAARTEQLFTQEVELKELSEPSNFAIVQDSLQYTARLQDDWATTSPVLSATATPPAPVAAPAPLPAAAATAAEPETAAPAAASTDAAPDAAAAAAAAAAGEDEKVGPAVPRKKKAEEQARHVGSDGKPLTFAEIARRNAASASGAKATQQPQRVVASTGKEKEKGKKEKETEGEAGRREGKAGAAKKDDAKAHASKAPGAAAAAAASSKDKEKDKDKKAPRARAKKSVIFYDIIVKGLPESTTEADVRGLITDGESCPIRLVKIDSQPSKRNPNEIRTCAFIQLDHDVLANAGTDLANAITKVLAAEKNKHGKVLFEAVKETKYTNKAAAAGAGGAKERRENKEGEESKEQEKVAASAASE